ncbi:Hypothetical protein CINCED_3A024512, partial [Cinara cedri]
SHPSANIRRLDHHVITVRSVTRFSRSSSVRYDAQQQSNKYDLRILGSESSL